MSRGDDNLDNLFKDAYSDKEHSFDPAFWAQTKHVYQAPVSVPFYTKPLFVTGVVSVLISSTIWFSNATPENNIDTNHPESKTADSITKNRLSESSNTLKSTQSKTELTNENNSSNITLNHFETIDNETLESRKISNKTIVNPTSTEALSNSKTGAIDSRIEKPAIVNVANTNQLKEGEKTIPLNTSDLNHSDPSLVKNEPNESSSKSTNSKYKTNKTTTVLAAGTVVSGFNSSTGSLINTNPSIANNTPTKTGIVTSKELSSNNEFNTPEVNPNYFDSPKPNVVKTSFSTLRTDELSLGFMQTKQDSYLNPCENEFTLSLIDYEELKSLNRPFSILLSTGYMGSKNLKTAQNRISTSAQDKNIELSLEYHFKPHWGAQIGLSYNETTESHSYNYLHTTDQSFWNYTTREITIQDRTWWLGGWHYYAPYQDTISDTAWVTKFDTSNAKLNAEHVVKIIEIPVLITYTIAVNRWNFQVVSGASVGFYAGSTGKVLLDNDPVQEQNTSKKLFNSVQYNYLLRTQVAFSISEHWQLSARPQMKMNLNSMYNSNSSQYQKYLFYGVNAGIIYRF